MTKFLLPILLLLSFQSLAQKQLTSEMLEKHAVRFSLTGDNSFPQTAHESWASWIGNNQFVGLAEVHNSKQ